MTNKKQIKISQKSEKLRYLSLVLTRQHTNGFILGFTCIAVFNMYYLYSVIEFYKYIHINHFNVWRCNENVKSQN